MARLKLSLLSGLTLCLFTGAAYAEAGFDTWLLNFKSQARQKGISQTTLDAAFKDTSFLPRVIELDRKQPEGRMSFAVYYKKVINQQRIDKGRALYQTHRAELNEASRRYGVPPQYIVALWGIETSYGDNTGGFGVIPSLATLAYEGRRAEFFGSELMEALRILEQGHISADKMKGSWAGAMGQNQFMPSSFHRFAVDGNNDGRRDIWTSLPDVFASTANYLGKSGWKEDERWGRRVKLPAGFSESNVSLDVRKSLASWAALGVRLPDGSNLPANGDMQASLVAPDGLSGDAFLVYDNYRVIMKWNKSTYFATSVGLLADQIAR